jgi:tRNA A-37 threonylcarbamoyl transferase component Bud32
MHWPSLQEYTKALANPQSCFADTDLAASRTDCDASGAPCSIVGNFAAIYKMHGAGRNWAVKCFLRGVEDQTKRYSEIQRHFARNSTENTIKFEYVERGIKVKDVWYPLVKMDWVEGETLDTFILANRHHNSILVWLLEQFKLLCGRLEKAQIAHGDLHHGNLIVTKQGLRLVDYDGAYVPALAGMHSSELGHHNYQHPKRLESDFAPYLDNFSAWAIYTSLQALAVDADLWETLAGGDECLLFRSSDYGNPLNSYAFSVLESHQNEELRYNARILRSLCDMPLTAVPAVGQAVKRSAPLPPLRTSVSLPRWIPQQQQVRDEQPDQARVFPNFRDFNEALRTPSRCFEDPELQLAMCLPEDTKVGANGRVYHFVCAERDLAIKCFAADNSQREQRYKEIMRADKGPAAAFMIDCQYIAKGVYINGEWYPLLKMPWVKGQPLSELACTFVTDAVTSYISDQFMTLMCALRTAGIAHGDIELANLIFDREQHELKIIDYDTMFVPALTRMGSPELGHPGFQSPRRTFGDYGPYVDNFSAWLIHFMLRHLATNPNLHELLDACLQEERQGSTAHAVLRALQNDRDAENREFGKMIRLMLERPLHLIPDISADVSLPELITKQSKEVGPRSGLAHRKPRSW